MKNYRPSCVPPSPIRKDDLGNSFSQRYINGYRTGYFLALRQICRG
jgi:hypothetical protein